MYCPCFACSQTNSSSEFVSRTWEESRVVIYLFQSSTQMCGISSAQLPYQPWFQRFVETRSTTWLRWKRPFCCRWRTSCPGRRWFCWLPGQGYAPILTLSPFPIFHTIPLCMRGKSLHIYFQIIECLIKFTRGIREMYLWVITYVQRLWVEMSLHPAFTTRYFANKMDFLSPHPPISLGLETWSHFTHGRTLCSLFPVHRNFEKILLIFSNIDFGIQASTI